VRGGRQHPHRLPPHPRAGDRISPPACRSGAHGRCAPSSLVPAPTAASPHHTSRGGAHSRHVPSSPPRCDLLLALAASWPALSSLRRPSACSYRAPSGPHPGVRTEYARRSRVELVICGSVLAKWLQRAYFAGLRLRSRG
jgi:hypothetical protein